MPIREDDIDQTERTLLEPGFYYGNLWSVERKPGISSRTGESYVRYLFTVRLIQDGDRNGLERPTRVVASYFGSVASSIKAAFGSPMLGKACLVDLAHRSYTRSTGQLQLDDDYKPVINPETGEPIELEEPAVAHDLRRIVPDQGGKAISREKMEEIEAKERPASEAPPGEPEEFPDTDKPF